MKKPLPWMAKSVSLPVLWSAPWMWNTSMPRRFIPSPTCTGFVPPRSAVAALAPENVCESASEKVTREDLKPAVLTLAMLLPTTSM